MRRLRPEALILPVVAVLVWVVDQASKAWITSRMELGQTMDLASWLAPVVRLTYITNTGVVFGMFPGLGDVLLIVYAVVIVLLLVYYRQLPPGQHLARIALGLQLGGALGNLTDRLARGAVVDFFDLNFWPLQNWAIFNVADASIVGGVTLFGVTLLIAELAHARATPEPEPPLADREPS